MKKFGWFLIFVGLLGSSKASYLLFVSNPEQGFIWILGIVNLLGGIMYIRRDE